MRCRVLILSLSMGYRKYKNKIAKYIIYAIIAIDIMANVIYINKKEIYLTENQHNKNKKERNQIYATLY